MGEDVLPEWVKENHLDDSGAVWYGSSFDPRRPSSADSIDPTLARLVDELFDPHPLRSHVITLHLYVEYWLDKLLKGVEESNAKHRTFHQKTERLTSLGVLEGDLLHNVRLINQLRNIFAHELDLASAEAKVQQMLRDFRSDPYFNSSDHDPFRAACVQTIFALNATLANGCKPVSSNPFPHDEIRAKLFKAGRISWQECELLSKEVRGTEHTYHLRCPLCHGTIDREKETLVGHKESHIWPCSTCGLRGDGYFLVLETANPEYISGERANGAK